MRKHLDAGSGKSIIWGDKFSFSDWESSWVCEVVETMLDWNEVFDSLQHVLRHRISLYPFNSHRAILYKFLHWRYH